MSLRSLLVLAAELGAVGIAVIGIGVLPAHAADATPSPAISSPSALLPTQLRDALSDTMRRANAAKGNDRAAAVKSLLDVYRDLGRDVLLPAKERLRLGVQVRVRLQRFASQIHYEAAHHNSSRASDAGSGVSQANLGQTGNSIAANTAAGAAAGPAVEGLDSLVELIQTTIGRPDDWVAAQLGGNGPALAGGVGFGGAGAARGGAFGGGAFGGNDALEKAADANGADLVDLIQKTVDPPSWDVNGGPGSIMYFNNLRVLVVRQTGDGQEDVGGMLGGLRGR